MNSSNTKKKAKRAAAVQSASRSSSAGFDSERSTPEKTLSRIDTLLRAIRARRQEIEEDRRLPHDLVEDLCATGVFSLCVPVALGGQQAAPLDVMRAIEKVSSADGSTGWCVMNGIAANNASGYMNEAGAREIYSDPSAPLAGVFAPSGQAERVDGGVRVSGRWAFASGITHCKWVWAGCMVFENGQPKMTPHGPEILHVFLPVADLSIHDTWHVSGLCGTGSLDFSVADLEVPERRTFSLLGPDGHRPEPHYQMPPVSLYVFKLASVALGIARGAIDELAEIVSTKTPTMRSDALAGCAAAQIEIARAEASLGGARAYLYETARDMWETVRAGSAVSKRQIALGRAAATQAAETAVSVTQTANRLAGGGSIFATSPLQRHARDAEALVHHFTVSPHTWEDAGRLLLGRETLVPVF